MEAAHRSIHPNFPGVPWWAAVLVAITATALGYTVDAGMGHKELTSVFAGFYIAGCVAAVLAVRQEGVFTAIIQPPLILFCAVPSAYWMFHGRKIGGVKDLLINCGYPLIERFPLMLGTAGGVLLIGLVRWYFGMSHRAIMAVNTSDERAAANTRATTGDAGSLFGGVGAKLRSILRPPLDEGDAEEGSFAGAAGARAAGSGPRGRRAARSGRPTSRTGRSRSRHSRQPVDEQEPPIGRSRRSSRRSPASARDYDTAEPPRRSRRRPRPDADPDLRNQTSRETRREPRTRRSPYERPAPRGSRFDDYDTYDRPPAPEHFGRYEAHDGYDRYEPGYAPKRRRPTNGAGPTHHPISQVRYRGAGPEEARDEPHGERRDRSRAHGRSQGRPPAESWEYDI